MFVGKYTLFPECVTVVSTIHARYYVRNCSYFLVHTKNFKRTAVLWEIPVALNISHELF
jgi:hypothetical protein